MVEAGQLCLQHEQLVLLGSPGQAEDLASSACGFEERMKAGWHAHDKIEAASDRPFRSQLADAFYWEGLYADTPAGIDPDSEVYDWLLDWNDIRGTLEDALGRGFEQSVLHLGCGNSALPEDMHDAGYGCQTCVDVSSTVIGNMKSRNRFRGIQWISADCTDLTHVFADDMFDIVIDKSAFDAIVLHDQFALMIIQFLKEAFRVTKLGGIYLCISLHDPEDVLKWLRQKAFGWEVHVKPLGTPKAHKTCAYLCKKTKATEHCLHAHWPALCQRVLERPDSDVDEEASDTGTGGEQTD